MSRIQVLQFRSFVHFSVRAPCESSFSFRAHCGVHFLFSHRLAFDSCDHFFGSRSRQKSSYFHGGGAFRLNAEDLILCVLKSVEQTDQRMEVTERAIRELQDQLQEVSVGHQAVPEALQSIHQEMNLRRTQIETRSRIRWVEPKGLMPDWFGKKTGPSWRTWPHLARDFFGVVRTASKQAMKNAEKTRNS